MAKQKYGKFSKSSDIISAKNPFKMDSLKINYEVDSDEEDMIEDAESLKSEDPEEDEEFMGDEEDDFVVSDGHLSDQEMSDLELQDCERSKFFILLILEVIYNELLILKI